MTPVSFPMVLHHADELRANTSLSKEAEEQLLTVDPVFIAQDAYSGFSKVFTLLCEHLCITKLLCTTKIHSLPLCLNSTAVRGSQRSPPANMDGFVNGIREFHAVAGRQRNNNSADSSGTSVTIV